jgi:hypothetical protein
VNRSNVIKVVTENLFGRLKFTVNTTIALFKPGGVPGDVEVKEVVAVVLEIQALAGCIGCQKDAHRGPGGVGIERFLDLMAFFKRSFASLDKNTLFGQI